MFLWKCISNNKFLFQKNSRFSAARIRTYVRKTKKSNQKCCCVTKAANNKMKDNKSTKNQMQSLQAQLPSKTCAKPVKQTHYQDQEVCFHIIYIFLKGFLLFKWVSTQECIAQTNDNDDVSATKGVMILKFNENSGKKTLLFFYFTMLFPTLVFSANSRPFFIKVLSECDWKSCKNSILSAITQAHIDLKVFHSAILVILSCYGCCTNIT